MAPNTGPHCRGDQKGDDILRRNGFAGTLRGCPFERLCDLMHIFSVKIWERRAPPRGSTKLMDVDSRP